MAPLPPVTDVIKYTQGWQVGANLKAESIFHFKYEGGPPAAADCIALAADFQSAFATELHPLMGANAWILTGTVLDLNSNTGAEGSGGTSTQGTRSGSAVGAQVALVVNHQIARRYRGGKPRSYLPLCVASDYSTTGTWAGGIITSVNTAFAAIIGSCLAATSGTTTIQQYGSVSYYLNKVLRGTPEWDPITASLARTRVGTQRRRAKTA
jgi:hypothetical protein